MITCGHCGNTHRDVDTVRACSQGMTVLPCTWLVERHGFDDDTGERWEIIVDCGAAAVHDDRGFECEAGHSHVGADVAYAEGWDYASDEEEAYHRARYGHESRLPDGRLYIPPPA